MIAIRDIVFDPRPATEGIFSPTGVGLISTEKTRLIGIAANAFVLGLLGSARARDLQHIPRDAIITNQDRLGVDRKLKNSGFRNVKRQQGFGIGWNQRHAGITFLKNRGSIGINAADHWVAGAANQTCRNKQAACMSKPAGTRKRGCMHD